MCIKKHFYEIVEISCFVEKNINRRVYTIFGFLMELRDKKSETVALLPLLIAFNVVSKL